MYPCVAKVRSILLLCALSLLTLGAGTEIQFDALNRDAIEARIESFSTKNVEREVIVKGMFAASGCALDHLSEQLVRKSLPPNVICVLPGSTDQVILVGAHFDKVDVGDGVVDNWSGASLLPSLLYSVKSQPRRHTFVFVSFTGEELGLLGSDFYVRHLTLEERSRIVAMINLDTLGLGPTEVWVSHADTELVVAMGRVAGAMKLPVASMNVDQVGTTDSESFARFKIPRITIHSVTQETWPILHSSKDKLTAVKMGDYYATYRLLSGYLAFLDGDLGKPVPAAPEKPAH